MHRRLLPALALTAGLMAAAPAGAQIVQPPVFIDTVSLSLEAEDWVKTETARVSLIVDAAGSGAEASQLRPELLKAAAAVADKAEWRILRLDRRQDEAGLDRWQAELEARLPEAQLTGLADRAKKVSRPGLQVRIGGVAFDPTLAETEAVRSRLREELYGKVTAELGRLAKVFPDRQFRVAGIDFSEEPMPKLMSSRMAMAPARGMEAADLVEEGVQEKLHLTARVTLGAFAVPPDATAPVPPKQP